MKLTPTQSALTLVLATLFAGPVHAVSSIADVPTLWPSEHGFSQSQSMPDLVMKNVVVDLPTPSIPEIQDR